MRTSTADQVLGVLSDGQIWTGQRLAERLGLSLRTVRRAIAALREDGVVVETDVGRGGGLRLGRHTGVPRVRLNHQEAVSLLFALALGESLRLPLLAAGLRPLRMKLAATFPARERSTIDRLRTRILVGDAASEPVRTSWRTPSTAQMRLLQEAFIGSRVVRFRYLSQDHRVSSRCVEPHCLLLNHPAWYLLALDRDLHSGRTFRLDGIQQIEIEDLGFTEVKPESLSPGINRWFRSI